MVQLKKEREMKVEVRDTELEKLVSSEFYNLYFNKQTGLTARWGKTQKDECRFSPIGPEILDIEITAGKCLAGCEFCYKCNSSQKGVVNMSFDTFKDVFDKMNSTKLLCQIAFGITDIYANPDFFKMMEYTRSNGVVPNYTTHCLDLDDNAIKRTAELCGAVAVSVVNKKHTFDAVKKFTDAGMDQVNIHYMVSDKTVGQIPLIVDEIKTDSRLEKLNSLVLLSYKHKNKNSSHSPISDQANKELILHCLQNSKKIGFDSCSASMFLKTISDIPEMPEVEFQKMSMMVEPCESSLFSSYVNVDGEFFPCSFAEGVGEWENGISVVKSKHFINDVWYHELTQQFRKRVINSSRGNPECVGCKAVNICRSCILNFEESNV
jgi:radical SAM protein with 4Fe4S-binding SPASM domain